MQAIVFVLVALVVFFLVVGGSRKVVAPQCPPGYASSSVHSTWAGWTFDCVPEGGANALVPQRTLTRPLTTIYAPIVAYTRLGTDVRGEPARLKEFAGRPTVI
jgi:hypothetical protein